MAIVRVQGNARGVTYGDGYGPHSATFIVTLASTPISGNVLVAVISLSRLNAILTVSSIAETGVTWTKQISQTKTTVTTYTDTEIWFGVVGAGASVTITITMSATTYDRAAVADVCEYSGVLTASFLDKTATNSGISTPLDTGTTATTTQASELWIGAATQSSSALSTPQSSPTNGFTLLDGAVYGSAMKETCGYFEKIVSAIGTANTGATCAATFGWAGCIATFKAAPSGTTYEINVNAVCQSSATPAKECTFNVAKDAAVSSQSVHARETTFNLPKDAISRALSSLAFELSFSAEAITKATAIPSEQLTFNITKNAQVTVQALSTYETLFNITKTAIIQALAQLNLETTFNINKDALVNASATIIIEAFIEILKDAVVQARALHSQETSFNVFADAKTEALASVTSEATYNLVKDAISTALADLQTETTFTVEKNAIVNAFADVIIEKLVVLISLYFDAAVIAQVIPDIETIIAPALHKWGVVLPFRLLQKYLATGRAVYLESLKKEITGKSIHPKRLNLEAHGIAIKPVRKDLTINFHTVHKALNLQGYGKAVRSVQAKGNLQGKKLEQVTAQLPVTGKQRLDLVLELLGIELTLTYMFVAVVDDKTCEHCMQHDTKTFTREQIDMQFPNRDDTDYTLILPNAHPHCRCLLILLEIGY